MGRTPARRALSGLLILVVVGALGWFGTRLAQGAFDDRYVVEVVVGESGQGVIDGSDVVARGVIIGKVGQIRLDEDLQAVVELVLEDRYTIPRDAMFAITGKTLLGEKQVEIVVDGPFDVADAWPDGALIDDPGRVVELQDVLQDLDELFAAIDPQDLAVVVDDGLGSFVGQEDAIARAVDQGARATDVFARSLDDQVPAIRDLSLVAEALGGVGADFNRLGLTIDLGALGTISDNQDRLRVLLASLDAFADQLDVVLELTRGDLDRLIIQGDNVTRLLFTYRPEVAELLVGISDYTDTIGNGGLTDPGFTGFGAGFQIIIDPQGGGENPLCGEAPPELAALIPICAAAGDGEQPEGTGEHGQPGPPAIGVPEIPIPLLTIPGSASGTPEGGGRVGIEGILGGLLGSAGDHEGGAS